MVELEPEHAPAAPDDFADERALLQAGMSVLSKRERRILELRYYEDRSQVDIAREIGLSQAQVSRLIRRALDRMRAAVVEEGAEAYPREEMATREVEEPQPQQNTHSGRLLVRMPQSLHAELARVAEHEGVSLNTLITGALASSVAWRDGAVEGLDVSTPGAQDARPARPAPALDLDRPRRQPRRRRARGDRGHRAAGRCAGPRLVAGSGRGAGRIEDDRGSQRARGAPPRAEGPRGLKAGRCPLMLDRRSAATIVSRSYRDRGPLRLTARAEPRPRMGRVAITRQTEPWSALLEAGRSDDRLVREAYEGARAPVFAELPADLHPTVVQGLANAGIDQLYSHQAQALEHAWEATTIVTTGTASGKSLCFNLPTLEVLCTDAKARALYLYPTKALAQDQARALNAFGLPKQVRPAIYDGDTRREERLAIRRRSNLVLTNPDMLHVGILPNHAAWADFFANLAVVVVDEAHVYRGVFGAHVGNVLRRLRRVAAAYGTTPRFLLASATIANPVELAERLTGFEDVRLVDEDGSPGARRQIAMWNPPVVDEALQLRRSALSEAAELVAELVREGARTICFIKSRKAVELVARIVREQLGPELEDRVAPYRAGYTSQQRRELEARLTQRRAHGRHHDRRARARHRHRRARRRRRA